MPRPPRATVILIWLICVSISFFFFLQRFQRVEEKKPHWFEMTSTLCHLYSVMLLSKEINLSVFFSPQCRVQKGRARSPFASVLNLLLVNSLWTFSIFLLSFSLKRHCESPSPHGIRTMGNRARVSRWYEQRGRGWNPNIQVRRKQKSHRWFAFAARPIAGE